MWDLNLQLRGQESLALLTEPDRHPRLKHFYEYLHLYLHSTYFKNTNKKLKKIYLQIIIPS